MRTVSILGLILLAKLVSVLTQLFAIVPMAAHAARLAICSRRSSSLRNTGRTDTTIYLVLIIDFKPQSLLSGFKFHTQKQLVTVRSELSNIIYKRHRNFKDANEITSRFEDMI